MRRKTHGLCLVMLGMFSEIATAGITLGGTRVIYNESLKETAIMVKNDGDKDIMIQSWIEPDAAQPGAEVPFALTPSLSRLAAKKQQSLRIFYAGQGLPSDRESAFWLSVQEIPQKSEAQNTLQIAVRQRIKVFYRPTAITGSQEEAIKQLKWSLVSTSGGLALKAVNASPYYMSFGSVKLTMAGKDYKVDAQMLAPQATTEYAVPGAPRVEGSKSALLEFNAINDYGALVKQQVNVSP